MPTAAVRRFLLAGSLGLVLSARLVAQVPEGPLRADWVLRGGTIVDGTGAPRFVGDLAIRGGRIVGLGRFETAQGAKILDATGLVVAPGFIDLHSHSDGPILRPETRANLNFLTQGVTTVVTGNCGSGPIDVAAFLARVDAEGAGTNVIHLVPHGAVRSSVMGGGNDAKADPHSLAKMAAIVERGMNDGAWGMSTGLIYLPGRYADTEELIALSRVVAKHGGFYASHMRDEGPGLLESIEELLTIGREAGLPVHASHLKASGRAAWGLVVPACERLAKARAAGQVATADQYPYVASSTSLSAMVVPHWARQGSAADFAKLAADPELGPKLRQAIEAGIASRNGGAAVRIARYRLKPSRVGKDLATIAREEGISVVDLVIDIEKNGGASAISFGMSEDDVRHVMTKDFVATASDGSAQDPATNDMPHPRSFGTFPRRFRYALDDGLQSLEAAVRSCSGFPAEVLRLPDRGTLKVGHHADIVVFDPKTFRDAATFDAPTRHAPGVKYLFVNGIATIMNGRYEGNLPGRALRLQQDGPPETILKVGRIWTGDPTNPWAEALAIRKGEIVAVGSAQEIAKLQGPGTTVLERPGAFATPGLIDAHGHLDSLGEATFTIDLRGAESPQKVAELVKAKIANTPGDAWILGRNWDQSLWPDMTFPTAKALDVVAPDRPVWLTRIDGHAAWANSEALRRANVSREIKSPPGGQILRDADGNPTGVFVDDAMALVARAIPEDTEEDVAKHLLAAQAICLENGLTCVHDAGVSPMAARAFRKLDEAGQLKLRVYGMATPGPRPVEFVSQPPSAAKPGARFEIRAIKLFMDGAMGSRGALVFEPYDDDPNNTGLYQIDPKLLEATTAEALRNGWQVCTHAIGDKGNALTLDAYENARAAVPSARDPRLRIEHAQVVRKQDVPRFAAADIIASMQPSHVSSDMRWADLRLGKDSARVQGAYAWRWFVDAGVKLAFGSDFPVEVANPLWGIYAAVTRRDEKGQPPGGWHPEQLLTMEETLRGFTRGSAYAMFAEDRLGVARPGYRADLTVFDRDLFQTQPDDLLKRQVLLTLIDGEVVYERR